MKRIERYEIIVKENRTPHALTPSMSNSRMTIEGVIDFFGLNEPDVEWYEIYEVCADGTKILVRHKKNNLTELLLSDKTR